MYRLHHNYLTALITELSRAWWDSCQALLAGSVEGEKTLTLMYADVMDRTTTQTWQHHHPRGGSTPLTRL